MKLASIFSNNRTRLDIVLAGTFIILTSYIVLVFELSKNRLFYFVFQTYLHNIFLKLFNPEYAELWFSNFNRIIFPITFWFISIIFLIAANRALKISFDIKNLIYSFKIIFILNIFLLLLKHQNLPYFWALDLPGNFTPEAVIPGYNKIGTTFLLIFYYGMVCFSLSKYLKNQKYWLELVPALSILIPLFYSQKPYLHLALILVGIFIFFINSWTKSKSESWNRFISPTTTLAAIYLIGLYFRLEYAIFFAAHWDELKLLSADGLSTYNSAFAFSIGHLDKVDFWRTPVYWMYLSFFFKFSTLAPRTLFIAQAFLGAFVPLIIFLILKELNLKKTGLIAAFLIAVSHFCIHNSVAINRASLQMITIPLMIYFVMTFQKKVYLKSIGVGFLLGLNFYLGLETFPIEFFIIGYLVYTFIKEKITLSLFAKLFGSLTIGCLIATSPINIAFHSNSSDWIPLGRDFSDNDSAEIWDLYINETSSQQLKSLGFIPGDGLIKNTTILSQSLMQTTKVLLLKFWIEFKGFCFDPSPHFLAPLHLLEESFFGANIEFYSYFFTLCGFFIFIFKVNVSNKNKLLITVPILLQTLSVSAIIYGVYRFRAPIVPLNFIFTAVGINFFLFKRKID